MDEEWLAILCISVISRLHEGDYEKLCVEEPYSVLPPTGLFKSEFGKKKIIVMSLKKSCKSISLIANSVDPDLFAPLAPV